LAMARCKRPTIKSKTTMPKLEMFALTLSMRLVANSMTQALEERIAGYPWTIHVFSDSQIALSWLTSPTTASLGVLVANRVREVRRIVTQLNNDSITVISRYVNTSRDPAGTRGLSREQMHDRYLWERPEFLKKPIEEWQHPIYQLWEDVIGVDSWALTNEAHGPYRRGTEHTIARVRERYWISKLRQQVREHVSHCIKCRRFNALPYQYLDFTELPERRVLKSNPFQHTELDFFDLPQCEKNERGIKLYGCIFTCTVTRLIHLGIVRSLAIEEFLNALRRFVACRGIPKTITCDNATTFLLAAKIIKERNSGLTEHAAQIVSNQEIQWRHITPYAPWQGGFYERLIKSVKQAINKAWRNSETYSLVYIHTFPIEVEACLNSRPLTYQSAEQEEFTTLRPIDFLQRDLNLSITLGNTESETQDPDYLPPDSLHGIQTRQQALEALNSSRRRIERFWKIWQQQYLISLRESHKKNPTNQRHGGITPSLGDVVLTVEQLQQQLQETKDQLQRLREAIPLPSPHEVYASIINEYLEVDRCAKKVASISRHIQIISRSQTSLECKARRISIILLKIENLRMRLAATKLHLTTLVALPPLLFATGAIAKPLWDEWMARPFCNDERNLLSTDPDRVKMGAKELMATLDSHKANLSDLANHFSWNN
uniref:Integrase catalytic domain-containing protein n=1 Tax=Haemonchus placei TaxID=6290 RepID=A0A0N4WD44_HAEPC